MSGLPVLVKTLMSGLPVLVKTSMSGLPMLVKTSKIGSFKLVLIYKTGTKEPSTTSVHGVSRLVTPFTNGQSMLLKMSENL